MGRGRVALENVQKALQFAPEDPDLYAQLARCYVSLQQKQLSYQAAKKAAELEPNDPYTLDAVAATLSLCDDQAAALPLAEKAVQLLPDNASMRYNLATMQRTVGQLEEAECNLDKVIEVSPEDCRAYYTRSDLRRQTPDNNHTAQIQALLEKGSRDWRGNMLLCFALAKEFGDLEDRENSFAYLKQACDLQRDHSEYDISADIETIDAIIATHSAEAFAACSPGHDSAEPIFIVGLPRTGTTLVERIIGSHGDVFAAGELQEFAVAMVRMTQGTGGRQQLSKLQMVEKSLTLDMKKLGAAYIESTRARTGHTPRFIDKLPLNYMYCGLIHAALPNAKIITLNRNPADACFAVYRAMFHSAYPFAYDLHDLGRYFVAWRRLMDHWLKLLGESILQVNYEDLVEDQEGVSREIIRFCDLEWQDACLEFYRNESASSTASAVQVRQPVYKSSIGRWRQYENQLEPLLRILRDNDVAYS